MMRFAHDGDFNFINSLVLSEAKNGHFDRNLLSPLFKSGWEKELHSVLKNRVRLDGTQAYGLIWEQNSKSIGFVVMSAGPNNEGNELWLAAIDPSYRKKGEGRRMVISVLDQFKGKNLMLMARCSPESETMFQILINHGFKHVDTGKKGSRGLIYLD